MESDHYTDLIWWEYWITPGFEPDLTEHQFYAIGVEQYFAFWDETRHPEAWILRAGAETEEPLESLKRVLKDSALYVDHVRWGAAEEVRFYGTKPRADIAIDAYSVGYDMRVQDFSQEEVRKIIHCILNAQGWTVGQELRWALKFARNRFKMWRLERKGIKT